MRHKTDEVRGSPSSLGARSLAAYKAAGSHRWPRTRSWACPQNTELGKQIGALDKRMEHPQGRTAFKAGSL